MITWNIQPYIGLGDIHFDSEVEGAITAIGEPIRDFTTRTGRRRIEFGLNKPALTIYNGDIVEISTLPEIEGGIYLKSINLLYGKEKDILKFLEKENGKILYRNGILVFFELGFIESRFNYEYKSQKSIVLFRKHYYWNGIKSEMIDFNIRN